MFVVGHHQHHERERGSNAWLALGWSGSECGGAPALGVKHDAAQVENRTEMEINLYFRALGLQRVPLRVNLSQVSGIVVVLGV